MLKTKPKNFVLEIIIDSVMFAGTPGYFALRGHRNDKLDLSQGESTINGGEFWALLENQDKTDAVLRQLQSMMQSTLPEDASIRISTIGAHPHPHTKICSWHPLVPA